MRPRRPTQSFRFWSLVAALVTLVATGATAVEQSKREVTVVGRKYTYEVADASGPVIRVKVDDLVNVTFSVSDIAHSVHDQRRPLSHRQARRARQARDVPVPRERRGRVRDPLHAVDRRALREGNARKTDRYQITALTD